MDTRQVLSSNSFIHFLSGCNAVCEINLFISAMEIRTNTFVDFLSVFFHAVCNSIYKKGGEMKLKQEFDELQNYVWQIMSKIDERLSAIEKNLKIQRPAALLSGVIFENEFINLTKNKTWNTKL